MSMAEFAVRDLHVAASDRECVRHVLRKLHHDAWQPQMRETRHRLLRAALEAHHAHQHLVREFRL